MFRLLVCGLAGGLPVPVAVPVHQIRLLLPGPYLEEVVFQRLCDVSVIRVVTTASVDADAVMARPERCQHRQFGTVIHQSGNSHVAGDGLDAVFHHLVPGLNGAWGRDGAPEHFHGQTDRATVDTRENDGQPGPGEDQTVIRLEGRLYVFSWISQMEGVVLHLYVPGRLRDEFAHSRHGRGCLLRR
ncbi:hypothetical protein Spa2297_34355 (plasmid) [Streptomyces parvulus]|uniref:Uncharacterized protein n=1 Tax=Streptomyces parvulus TaxID=146923 RepID=A0A191VB98_9ACTN|nr:hypothetical protein Spa2297_34355 [Streptomyces parvulus]